MAERASRWFAALMSCPVFARSMILAKAGRDTGQRFAPWELSARFPKKSTRSRIHLETGTRIVCFGLFKTPGGNFPAIARRRRYFDTPALFFSCGLILGVNSRRD